MESSENSYMTIGTKTLCAAALALSLSLAATPAAQQPSAGPTYSSTGELLRPPDFREWIFLTSGLGMTYNAPAANAPARPPAFTTVYVNPPAYRYFMQTGRWP
jgi:hypothetical protein